MNEGTFRGQGGTDDGREGPIESLRKKLYARDATGLRHTAASRSELHQKRYDVQTDWRGDEEIENVTATLRPRKGMSVIGKFLMFSIIFFAAAVAIALFIVYRQGNIISTKNVDITVSGPVSVGGGEVLAFQVEILNNNPTTLEVADLFIEFPDGTREAGDLTKELPRFRQGLGDIEPGGKASKTVEAVLFGETGSKHGIAITVEYRVSGSNAIFHKDRLYEVEVSSAPLNVAISVPKEINAGQAVEIDIEVTSNAQTVIENALLAVEYPFGFVLSSSVPEIAFDENVWDLGDVDPRSTRRIRLVGYLEGQDEEERTFRFFAGIASERDEGVIGTQFVSTLRSVTVKRPFIQLDLVLDGRPGGLHVAESGRAVRADITWRNNLPTAAIDAVIEAKLSGAVLDKSSVAVRRGFYRSIDNTVVWDKTQVSELGSLAPGDTGSVSFTLASTLDPKLGGAENATMSIEVRMVATRLGDADTAGPVTSSGSRTIQLASDVRLNQRAVYSVGPIENTGPMPLRAEEETTYTVIWSVTNSSNDITDTGVRATLPPYARWTGIVSPADAPLSYNSVGGEVIWRTGDVTAGVGFSSSPLEVAFQIGITPSVSQIDGQPTIIGDAALSTIDTFTKTELTRSASDITTRISSDPAFKLGDDRVQPPR